MEINLSKLFFFIRFIYETISQTRSVKVALWQLRGIDKSENISGIFWRDKLKYPSEVRRNSDLFTVFYIA